MLIPVGTPGWPCYVHVGTHSLYQLQLHSPTATELPLRAAQPYNDSSAMPPLRAAQTTQ